MEKLAVVLFNLGGPDSPEAIRPFLFNLFNDPAIIGAPAPIRRALAWLISTRRESVAKGIYAHLGGRSPLLELTRDQASAIEARLGDHVRVFIAMRYWTPFTDEAVSAVKAWNPDRIVLLPLYPQFSTTTTASSVKEWGKAAAKAGLVKPTTGICCYPTQEKMIRAQAALLEEALQKAGTGARVLFSAHGLPKKVIERGDPYQSQVEMTARAIVTALGRSDLDWLVSYQSRVGPMEWIGPATDAEIRRAGAEGKALVVQPVAFVSEHSETLVELDIEYAHLAKEAGVPLYVRVPALGSHPLFIEGLADLIGKTASSERSFCSEGNDRQCGEAWKACGHAGVLS
ncbi:ferrochelatase [Telmatospirillum siberiense]|uniref:Ferrochelatase n=1 Tax=Telmatospirillum siberiense TaxID=382514 RepID=A0A2N3PMY6_9PROT|nr:ferrochelatase [Telmatospirillum siberiense]PKU21768.1 ferrochelatase [Telmatospirillum siberiense]